MGSITMTGANGIDWSAILEAVMTQESQPLTTLETRRDTAKDKITAFSSLATKLSALQSAAEDLGDVSSFGGRAGSSTDSSAIGVSVDSDAALGDYDIVVTTLARAQVTTLAGSTALPDKDTTVVATGGSLRFLDPEGNETAVVELAAGSYTLEQLATAINDSDAAPVRATVVQAAGEYKLVLTGMETGAENAFTLENNLTGGAALTQATVKTATDADFTVNNVRITSASNTVTDAIAGVTLSLLKTTGTESETVTVTKDLKETKDKITAFVKAYNSLLDFASDQARKARDGETGNIGFDPLLRSLRQQLSAGMNRAYSVGGSLTNLSLVGIEFLSTGKLKFDEADFDDAMDENPLDVERLLGGTGSADGAFDAIQSLIEQYSKSGGLVADAKDRLEDQVTSLDKKISDMEERLALRRTALQAEYAAADALISQLNQQGNTLSALR